MTHATFPQRLGVFAISELRSKLDKIGSTLYRYMSRQYHTLRQWDERYGDRKVLLVELLFVQDVFSFQDRVENVRLAILVTLRRCQPISK